MLVRLCSSCIQPLSLTVSHLQSFPGVSRVAFALGVPERVYMAVMSDIAAAAPI